MLLFVQHNLTQLMIFLSQPDPHPPPPTNKKVFGFAKISWVPFLKVGLNPPKPTRDPATGHSDQGGHKIGMY